MGSNFLYEDVNFKVEFDPGKRSHWLYVVGMSSHYLQEGIFEELAETSLDGLEDKLDAVDRLIMHSVREAGFHTVNVAYALSQARIVELQQELEEHRKVITESLYIERPAAEPVES